MKTFYFQNSHFLLILKFYNYIATSDEPKAVCTPTSGTYLLEVIQALYKHMGTLRQATPLLTALMALE